MRFVWLIIIFFWCLSSFKPLSAQNVGNQSFTLDSKIAKSLLTKNKHDILFSITNGNPALLSSIHFKYSIFSSFFLQKTVYGTSDIMMNINKIVVTGDTLYRSFGISKSIVPDCYNGIFTLHNHNELIQNKQFSINKLDVDRDIRIGFCDFEEIKTTKLKGSLTDFNFSINAIEKIENHLKVINDYWSSCVLFDSLRSEMDFKNAQNSNNLSELFIFWDKTRKAVKLAKETINNPLLQIDIHDPKLLKESVDQYDRLLLRFHTLFQIELLKRPNYLTNDVISDQFLLSVEKMRLTSTKVGFYDANLFSLSSGLIIDESFVKIINQLEISDQSSSIIQKIYDGLKQTAFSLFLSDDFANAIFIFNDLRSYEQAFQTCEADSMVKELYFKAKEGLLNSYLQIASRAMAANNYAMAENYHQKAETFRRQYYTEYQPIEISDVTGSLVYAYFEKGMSFKKNEQFDEAITYFEKAYNTSKNFGNIQYLSDIEKSLAWLYQNNYKNLVEQATNSYKLGDLVQAANENELALNYRENHLEYLESSTDAILLQQNIKQPYLSNSIANGMVAAKNGEAKKALAAYEKAEYLVDEFKLTVNVSLDSLTKASAKINIIETIQSANVKVWANEMKNALEIYGQAKEMQQKYQLENDSLIQDEFLRLDAKMIKQSCINRQRDYDELMQKIEKSIKQYRYDELANNLSLAIEIGEQNQGCSIDIAKVKSYRSQYQNLIDYHKRYNEVMKLMYAEGFANAISGYDSLDRDINNYHLDKYNLKYLDVIQFVENQNNSGLTRIAFQYFLTSEDLEKALVCFHLIQQQSVNDVETNLSQKNLAENLAKRDVAHTQQLSAEQLAFGYFGEDKRNKSLRQLYLKIFKNSIKN